MQFLPSDLMTAASDGNVDRVAELLEQLEWSEGDLLVAILLAEASEHHNIIDMLEAELDRMYTKNI